MVHAIGSALRCLKDRKALLRALKQLIPEKYRRDREREKTGPACYPTLSRGVGRNIGAASE